MRLRGEGGAGGGFQRGNLCFGVGEGLLAVLEKLETFAVVYKGVFQREATGFHLLDDAFKPCDGGLKIFWFGLVAVVW